MVNAIISQSWRIIIKILKLIYFSVECCEIVVAINYEQRFHASSKGSSQIREPSGCKEKWGRPENFPPTLPNIINENYIFLWHFLNYCKSAFNVWLKKILLVYATAVVVGFWEAGRFPAAQCLLLFQKLWGLKKGVPIHSSDLS